MQQYQIPHLKTSLADLVFCYRSGSQTMTQLRVILKVSGWWLNGAYEALVR